MIQRNLLFRSGALCSRSYYPSRSVISRSLPQPLRIPPPRTNISPRCYSTTTETEGGATTEAAESEVNNDDPTKKELEAKSKEIIELKDRYLRSVADFRNLQDRTKRDVDSARAFAITRFAGDLIESVDNLDRALGTVPAEKVSKPDSNKELVDLYEGLKMTDTILMQTLKKHGLERFDPAEAGDMFNPNLHEATFQTKVEGKEDGQVFTTQQKGFLLNGRVVRAAKVGVAKNS